MKHDFNDDNGLIPAHKHSNGGGWVADTAYDTYNAVEHIKRKYPNAYIHSTTLRD